MNPPDNIIYYYTTRYALKTIRIEDTNNQIRDQLIIDLGSLEYNNRDDYSIQSYIDNSTYVRIFNDKMLQDKGVRDVLLEYLI